MPDQSAVAAPHARPRIVERVHVVVDRLFAVAPRLLLVLSVIAGAGSVLALFLAGLPDWSQQRTWLVWTGVGSFVGAGLLAVGIDEARRRETLAKAAEGADAQLALTDAVQPVLMRIATLVSRPSEHRAAQFQKAVSAVLQALPTLFPNVDQARMVVYRVDSGRGRRKRLSVEDSTGRTRDRPQPFVTGEGGRGDAVFAWLETKSTKFVPNIETEQDPAWQGSGRGYKTFISAAIWADDEIFGMLTVDAPQPGDLDETDQALMTTLAHCLAIAYTASGR